MLLQIMGPEAVSSGNPGSQIVTPNQTQPQGTMPCSLPAAMGVTTPKEPLGWGGEGRVQETNGAARKPPRSLPRRLPDEWTPALTSQLSSTGPTSGLHSHSHSVPACPSPPDPNPCLLEESRLPPLTSILQLRHTPECETVSSGYLLSPFYCPLPTTTGI